MINYTVFEFSPFDENTYVVWEADSREAMVIDPGCHSDEERKALKSFFEKNRLDINFLINTHCHIDHIFGNAFIKKNYNCLFLAPEEDVFLLQNAPEQAKMFGIDIDPSPLPDEYITESTDVSLGGISPQFIFTPGHTPGEHSIYFEENQICFTGDVLFNMSIGRTDLWRGDMNTLMKSINEKLLTLPDDVKILPGHGRESTIFFEKKNNPFLHSGYG